MHARLRKPSAEELELLHSELCSALNDKTRVAILYELAGGVRHVSAIVSALRLPQATVSRHLKILRDRNVVRATRNANRVLYELEDTRVLEVLELLRQILAGALQRQRAAADSIERGRARPPRRTARRAVRRD